MKPIKEIRDALGIEREAVGVKYTDESPTAKLADGQYAVCNGILEAANGKVIMLSKENCACGGGKSSLGADRDESGTSQDACGRGKTMVRC